MQKTTYKILVISFILILFSNVSCKKPTSIKIITLYDKPLDVIKSYSVGKWSLNYTYGGLTGNLRNNYQNTVMQFKYGARDSFYYTIDKKQKANSSIQWIKRPDVFGRVDSVYSMLYTNELNSLTAFSFNSIKNDTLIIEDAGPDGFLYYLTK